MVNRDGTLHKCSALGKLETKGDQENLEPSHLPLAREENRQSGDEYNI